MKKQRMKNHKSNPATQPMKIKPATSLPEVPQDIFSGAPEAYLKARADLATNIQMICAAIFPGQGNKVAEPIIDSIERMIDTAIEIRTGAC